VEGLATNPPDLAPKFPAYSDPKGPVIKDWNGGGRKPRQDTKSPHLIRNEPIDWRATDNFRDCQSVEEIRAKIRDELGPEAAAALRRFNRVIEFSLGRGLCHRHRPVGHEPLEPKFYLLRFAIQGITLPPIRCLQFFQSLLETA
jgi:hypothetical protein